ncbi:MAG: MBL fold metallo-hydrolase [Pseudomonadota bacterium]
MTTGIALDRRSLLIGSAAIGAAAALPAGKAQATAEQLGVQRPSVYRFKIGAFEVTTILDGAIQLPGPHPIFGQNVEQSDVAALAAENFLPADMFEIPFTVTVVNTGNEVILFDTGNGARRRPNAGLLLEMLGSAGLSAEAIDHVVITHFHGDHIGGLMENGAPAFPNANLVLGKVEYDHWSNPALLEDEAMKGRAALVQANVVPLAEKARMIEPGEAVVSGVEAVNAFGHTPGHMVYHLESEGKRLLITADTANHYVMSLQKPDWHVRFDMDKDAAVATRKTVFGMIAADKIPFVGYHMPAPAVGYVEPMAGGFRYVPASYQLNL